MNVQITMNVVFTVHLNST